MTNFVLDCSITICWLFEEEKDAYSIKVLESLKKAKALVPYLWNYEISNVLVTALKKRKVKQTDCSQFIDDLNKLPIEVVDRKCDIIELMMLSDKYNLTAYDGAYLSLCMSTGCSLATHDQQLASSAKKSGVNLYLK